MSQRRLDGSNSKKNKEHTTAVIQSSVAMPYLSFILIKRKSDRVHSCVAASKKKKKKWEELPVNG
jgi:hypothetical protein